MRTGTRTICTGLALVCALLAGCGDDSNTDDAGAAATTIAISDFPVTVTGDNGQLTIETRPERIVVLSPSLTEMVFAIGAGDQVVAVDAASDYPAGTPLTDLSGFRPNVEAIGALEPDLVLVARDRDDVVATLASVGIRALVLPAASNLDDVYEQIDTLGAATGHADAAEVLANDMRAAIDEQFARAPQFEVAPTYFYEISPEYHSNTSETFTGSILAALGLDNIADGVDPAAGAYPQLNAEFVLESNPQWVFIAHSDGSVPAPGDLEARPGWTELDAVTADRVVFLDPDVASRWGPRVVELVTSIVDALVAGGE